MSVDAPHRPAFPWLRAPSTPAAWMATACTGWRGPTLAALLALISALPGLLALPPLDRDESRSAQATAQMLETGDPVNVRFQQEPGDRKPVAIYWLQAACVTLFSSTEDRDIWPYRLPSLLGAMVAAAACAWGAGGALGNRAGTLAGAVLGAGLLLSSEAFMAKTDALLCGATTLAMAGLGRLYLSQRHGAIAVGWRERAALWIGLAAGVLDKGPIAPMVVGLTMLALAIADRRLRWLGRLGWGWGLILILLVAGPWFFAITIATDGGFWAAMLGGDPAAKVAGAHEGHGGSPGEHALLAPILSFPFGLMSPAALIAGWRRRDEPAVRFAVAWLVPSWLVFELLPTKLAHDPLPLYGALAWLTAAAATGKVAIGPWARRLGAALGVGVGAALAVAALTVGAVQGAGSASTLGLAGLLAALALASGGLGGWRLLQGRPQQALVSAGLVGVVAHMAATGLFLPGLAALWPSERAARLLDGAGLDPRDGRTVGPVAVAGYAEPSLVFALGTDTELDHDGSEAAEAVAAGSPAFVEHGQDAAFRDAVAKRGAVAQVAGVVSGFDYSTGRPVRLTLWRPTLLPPTSQTEAPPPDVAEPETAGPEPVVAPVSPPAGLNPSPEKRPKETRR